MAQGMQAHEEDKEFIFGKKKPKPTGEARKDLAPPKKEETQEERSKRQNDEVFRAEPKDREAIIKRHNEEDRQRREKEGK